MVFAFSVKIMEVQMSERGTSKQRSHRSLFSIAVFALLLIASIPMAAEKVYGAITLSWTAPTTNTDGSSLTDLTGYNLHYGSSSGVYGSSINIGNVTSYTLNNLQAGNYYFALTAYNSLGVNSADSNEVVKTVYADTTPPLVTAFSIPDTSASLTIQISTVSATDDVGVTGYLVNESSAKPAAAAGGWTSTVPASYTFTTAGSKTLYAWAKDAAGNVSASRSASVTVTLPDTTAPTVSVFTVPSSSASLTVSITSFTATDNIGVTGYQVNESSAKPVATAGGWTSSAPSTYTFTTAGSKTLYAWAKDAAGNVSASRSALVTVTVTIPDTTVPTVSSFTIPSSSTSLTVSITSFTAIDNVGVTGYLVSESGAAPSAAAGGWTASAPSSYTFTTAGSKTLYAWAKDAAGNVSATAAASVMITLADTTAPVISITAPASGLTVSGVVVITANATDNVGVAGVQFKLDNSNLGAEDISSPYSISWDTTTASNGLHTLTAVARDSAGNMTSSASVSVTVNNTGITTVTLVPASDTFINVDSSSNSASAELTTYTWPAGSAANAILMKFDLSVIPAGAVIQSAALNLYLLDSDSNASYPLYNLTLNAVINHNPNLLMATGYTYDGTNSWTPNALAYDNIPLAQADISVAYDTAAINKTTGFKAWNATQLVKDWLSTPSTNYGLMINSDRNAPVDTYRNFASFKNSTAGMRPYMTVTYVSGNTADTISPVVTGFTAPAASSSLTVSITSFTATDNIGVTGYLVNESATAPSASAGGWTSSAPTSYTFATAGGKTLYAWARDAAGNVSAGRSASVTVTLADTTAPTVSVFTVPSSSASLTVSITSFTATDNISVTGYLVNESATAPSASAGGWTSSAPTSYIFATAGSKTLYAWARDAAGNVSAGRSASVTVTLADTTAPTVTSFTISTSSAALTIAITSFTATDNVKVTGYMLTKTSTAPSASAAGWTATPPTSYKVSSRGTYTLYAWAKDAAGKVSKSVRATVQVRR
jgi:hypothetical protein